MVRSLADCVEGSLSASDDASVLSQNARPIAPTPEGTDMPRIAGSEALSRQPFAIQPKK
jgi:hypothetical protein